MDTLLTEHRRKEVHAHGKRSDWRHWQGRFFSRLCDRLLYKPIWREWGKFAGFITVGLAAALLGILLLTIDWRGALVVAGVLVPAITCAIVLVKRQIERRLRKVASERTEEFRRKHGKSRYTTWDEWPVDIATRRAIEIAKMNHAAIDLVIGKFDSDGRVFGCFGPLPGFEPVSEADFVERERYRLEIVLREGVVLVKKDFRGDVTNFLREWHNLAVLSERAYVPPVYAADTSRTLLYKNLIPGRTIRDILVDAGAKILHVHTRQDPDLQKLDAGSRIEAVWARGRSVLPTCFTPEFLLVLEDQVERIHRAGITGFSLTYGNVMADRKRTTPWFIDFESARFHRSTSGSAFQYECWDDWRKFRNLYREPSTI